MIQPDPVDESTEPEPYEQECERCGGPFEETEPTSLCPECEAAP